MSTSVFLVDDHKIVREGLRLVLEEEPDLAVVGEAGNGREALGPVATLCPDVVLMDIEMPELDGITAAAWIKRECPSTRVIILSMHTTREYVFRALQAGVYGYLPKNATGQEIVDAIRAVHSGRHYLSYRISEQLLNSHWVYDLTKATGKSPLEQLSPREAQILGFIIHGQTTQEIANRLKLSPKTVETYRSRLMRKLGVPDLPGLIKFAIEYGLISLE